MSDYVDIEPWPEPVEGAYLFNRLTTEAWGRYCGLVAGAPEVLSLWTAFTWGITAFQHAPRLFLTSAVRRCGKSTVLDVLGHVARRPRRASSLTASSMFRVADAISPTLLVDEADTFAAAKKELIGIMNSGHTPGGAFVEKTEPDRSVRRYNTFIPIAIAAIGGLPPALEDRAITIFMQRGRPPMRFREDRAGHLDEIARMLMRWFADNFDALREADPVLPPGLNSRAEDNFRPLCAIADAIGGDWPEMARRAIKLIAKEDEASLPEL